MRILAKALLLAVPFISPAASQEFDVASVRVASTPQACFSVAETGAPGTPTSGRYSVCLPLQAFLIRALDVQSFRIDDVQKLPNSLVQINATFPPDTSVETFRSMLLHLIQERFGLTFHRITRGATVYDLVVAPSGHKLRENTSPEREAIRPDFSTLKKGPDGQLLELPAIYGRIFTVRAPNGHIRGRATAVTMDRLLGEITGTMQTIVNDKTGLKARYDFAFEYDTGGGAFAGQPRLPSDGDDANNAPPLQAALREQLGLLLKKERAPIEFVVVDSIRAMPTEN